jgi:hypothetical protein
MALKYFSLSRYKNVARFFISRKLAAAVPGGWRGR